MWGLPQQRPRLRPSPGGQPCAECRLPPSKPRRPRSRPRISAHRGDPCRPREFRRLAYRSPGSPLSKGLQHPLDQRRRPLIPRIFRLFVALHPGTGASPYGVLATRPMQNFLEFERPIAELEVKIQELRQLPTSGDVNITDEILTLEA